MPRGHRITSSLRWTFELFKLFYQHYLLFQVITKKNIEQADGRLMSIATKVMTQMACKLGAEPWKLHQQHHKVKKKKNKSSQMKTIRFFLALDDYRIRHVSRRSQ